MAFAAAEGDNTVPNDPKAVVMALIGFLTFNVVIGSIFGSPGVLLKPMMARLDATNPMISAASLAVIVSSAIFAPMIGSLAVRHSLRLIVGAAAVMRTSSTPMSPVLARIREPVASSIT